jgi:hypothetical protein
VNGGVVTTLAGNGSPAFADGTGTNATFYYPFGIAVLPDGNIVVADTFNNRIRLVNPTSGVVTTLAGSGQSFADGTGTSANFNNPYGVAVIPSSSVIVVADSGNNRIRLVTYPGGVVTTLAGSGSATFADGTGTAARFSGPHGVAVTSTGDIVVADADNNRIRLVTQAGVVTTLAGSSAGLVDATGTAARFSGPRGVAVTSTGDIVVVDTGNNNIRLVTYPGGVVTTLAGSGGGTFADGTGTAASFNIPQGIAMTPTGVIVVADTVNQRVRLVTSGGVVTTLAGQAGSGSTDGTGTGASFWNLRGVALTSSGRIVVADTFNNRIRLIT